jgi:SAM-dependent methyltransferase
MTGVDISEPMVAELVRKCGGRSPFPLALGDATVLPFVTGAFGGVVIRHVLHLIRDWRGCVAEVARVVEPGGVVLIGHGDYQRAWREAQRRFLEVIGRKKTFLGWDPGDMGALDDAFAAHGATGRDLEPVRERAEQSLGDFIGQMGEGLHSWTWDIDPVDRERAAALTLVWALERFGSPDPPEARDRVLLWRAYDLPAGGPG